MFTFAMVVCRPSRRAPASSLYRLVFAAAILCLIMAGCRNIQYREDDQYGYLTILLEEQDVSNLIVGILTGGNTPLMRSATADLRAGQIYVSGEINDGRGGTLPGTLSVQFWQENGDLMAAIGDFNFAGWVADQALISRINGDIAQGFRQSAANDTSGSDFTQVVISDTALSFTIRTPRRTPTP